MALSKLFNLFAISSLAVLLCSVGTSPVNALAHDGHHLVKVKRAHGHEGVAKRKRDNSQRCKTRPSTSASSTDAATTTPETTAAAPPTSPESSSTSSSAPAATSSTTTSSGSGKVGLAWANGDVDYISNFVTDQVKYIYTWSESCPSKGTALGLQCIPMLWGGDQSRIDAFTSTVKAGYANIVAGFNEPNEAGQSNMAVSDAVPIWQKYIQPLKNEGYQLLAPVTSSAPAGLTWVQDFVNQCSGCSFDGYPVHYYGTNATAMIEYIENWHNTFNGPIWVTEFACQNFNRAYENNGQDCSESQVWEFYKTIINWMQSTDYVVAWFAFGFMHDMQGVNTLDQLLGSDNNPTSLGSSVINVSFN